MDSDLINGLFTYFSELSKNPTGVTNLRQLSRFTKNFAQEDFPERDVKIWTGALARGYNNTSPEFWKAYQNDLYLGGRGGLLGALKRDKLDAVVFPTTLASAFAAITGSPIVTVPLGFYPRDTKITMNSFGNLVASSPNFP